MKASAVKLQVTVGGKAYRSGINEGDIIEKVNGEDFVNLSHHEALNKIKNSGPTLTMRLRYVNNMHLTSSQLV